MCKRLAELYDHTRRLDENCMGAPAGCRYTLQARELLWVGLPLRLRGGDCPEGADLPNVALGRFSLDTERVPKRQKRINA